MNGVSGVNNSADPVGTPAAGAAATPANNEAAAAVQSTPGDEAAVFEKSGDTGKTLYTRDNATLGALRMKDRAYIQNLQTLVSQLVNQVNTNLMANGKNKFHGAMAGRLDPSRVESYWDLLIDNGDGTFSFHPDLSPEAQNALIAKAKEDIGEDGYYGVKQTSQRILDFAKAITGGDPSKVEDMRKYIQQGFDEVRRIFGGELPEICNQTYDVIMKGLDDWAASAK
ncbi:MAG: hypothetical protein LBH95_04925 [Oscillospiraceae bacterium]|jgi:hypothetical protein|nr:hypothetical protein [Oscillospiraceae bacterium]